MINKDKLKFGDIVYEAEEKNNAFTKKKLTTVINGVEWFRYDRDHWEYSVKQIVYCGKITVIKEGQVDSDNDTQNQLHFKHPDGNIYYEYEANIGNLEDWFHTREEAKSYIEKLKVKRSE